VDKAPRLKFLHSETSLVATKIDAFGRVSTQELKASLETGKPGALKTRLDGTVLDGHHRLSVLLERE
jgi:hypothetical protein